MAWTSPAAAVAGTVATAAFANTNYRDNLTHLYGTIATFSPTVTQSGAVTLTTAVGRYRYVGNTCYLHCGIDFGGVGTITNDVIIGNIPAAIAPRISGEPSTSTLADVDLGSFYYFDSGTGGYGGACFFASSSTLKFKAAGQSNNLGTTPNIAIAAADAMVATIVYETAVGSS